MSCAGESAPQVFGEVIVKRTDLQELIGIAAQLMGQMKACRNGCKEDASDQVVDEMRNAILSHLKNEHHWETQLSRSKHSKVPEFIVSSCIICVSLFSQ